ncbi:uncharacterized protein LOC114944398 [Nylanderia fulva]|uniref:uncharacterized protein LOC114944398 n=1 Tax=Nylanderia fulva TaxID=613905 RepID=UPI0010FAD194|nr:uncharacterized protein LOC114944398 [Nylanderia fulva]
MKAEVEVENCSMVYNDKDLSDSDLKEKKKNRKGTNTHPILEENVETDPATGGKEKRIKVTKVTTLNPPANAGKSAVTQTNQKRGKQQHKQQPPKQVSAAGRQTASMVAAVHGPQEKGEQWTTVVKRKKKEGDANRAEQEKTRQTRNEGRSQPIPPQSSQGKAKLAKRKEPRTAANTLTCPEGKYAEIMREARTKIEPQNLGIKKINMRRSITEAMVYEIPGENKGKLADKLAAKLRKTLKGKEGVRISRPVKMAEIRILGLEESIALTEVVEAIATFGKCEQEEIQTGDIKISPNGLGSLWARCPLVAANRLVTGGGGRIKIGWGHVQVTLLEQRPLQCYRCLEGGHVRQRCPNRTDRSNQCYCCGREGHVAKECSEDFNCPVCRDRGLPAKHRTGSKACTPVQKGVKGVALNKLVQPPKQPTPRRKQALEEEPKDREKIKKGKGQETAVATSSGKERTRRLEEEEGIKESGTKRRKLRREHRGSEADDEENGMVIQREGKPEKEHHE